MENHRVLLFGGTTEGREVATYLDGHGIDVHVCVTTAYGEELVRGAHISCTHEPLDEPAMEALMRSFDPELTIDATHPYAAEVSRHVAAACEETGIPYRRLLRAESADQPAAVYVSDADEAAAYLKDRAGAILLTTGSKELNAFLTIPDYEKRLYVRLLPTKQALSVCEAANLSPGHILCMQGPFSEAMNEATLTDYQIRYLVTKESGSVGGFPQKAQAAAETGTTLVVIGRPVQETGLSFSEMIAELKERFSLTDPVTLSLVGIGPGNGETLTREGAAAIAKADLLLGAGRMIQAAAHPGQTCVTAYQPADIVQALSDHPEARQVAVVLSGDVGFYSGAKGIADRLSNEPAVTVKWLPGLSSIAYFCARLQVSWEDACLASIHGREVPLIRTLCTHRKTLVLVSGAADVRALAGQMVSYGMGELPVSLGSDLSYETECIRTEPAQAFASYDGSDLCLLYIENPDAGQAMCVPGIPDDAFIRGDVPMTKAEVRSVVLSKLQLTPGDILYDIGAGTGSVSVEAALALPTGFVYAVERDQAALQLLEENQHQFRVDNLILVPGEAPAALTGLPIPDAVFIGGSGGHLTEILSALCEIVPGAGHPIRVAATAITLESVSQISDFVDGVKGPVQITEEEVVQIAVSKSPGGKRHMMLAQNPVYLFGFTLSDAAEREAD